jgi:hypothetical protein
VAEEWSRIRIPELVEWLKWYNDCLASKRLRVQTSVLPKKKKKEYTIEYWVHCRLVLLTTSICYSIIFRDLTIT